MYYYQVGGLDSHTFQWFRYDTRALADCIFYALSGRSNQYADEKKAAIELVLGIKDNGASYVLMPQNQMDAFLQARNMLRRPQDPPRHASVYASLSPITFHSPAELQSKLKTYEQNARKKKIRRAPGQDTSPANKMFDQYNPARACFEHQRVLWSSIQNPIDQNKFGLYELPTWISSTSFVALTLQTWKYESIEKQRTDPTILSLELSSVRCISFREVEDYASQISNTICVKIKEHSHLSNGPSMCPMDETLEAVNKTELGKRLNDFFASIDSKYALLLVYNAQQTLSALRKLGVDVSTYEDGIDTLLYGENKRQEDNEPSSSGWGKRDNHHHRLPRGPVHATKAEPRVRSHSPWRRPPDSGRPQSPPLRNGHEPKQEPPPTKVEALKEEDEAEEDDEDAGPPPPAKVHVLDVRSLFLAVSRFDPGVVKGLCDLAGRLGIPRELNDNGGRFLIEAWRTMASGKSIDEQHAERASLGAFAAPAPRPTAGLAPLAASDEEFDPNDVVVNPDAPQRPLPVIGGGLRPPTDDFDSDDSDF